MDSKIATLTERISNLVDDCKNYVTRIEFNSRISPLEKVVYGMVSAILLAVLAGALRFFIK